jgi:hypothetical protein
VIPWKPPTRSNVNTRLAYHEGIPAARDKGPGVAPS